METVLVWAPFAFLLLFAPLDIYYAKTSKYGDIPWGFHNGCRMLLIVLLVAHSVADLAVGATWHGEESNVKEMFTVHWVTPVIRIVMFVSGYSKCISLHNNFKWHIPTDLYRSSYIIAPQKRYCLVWPNDHVLAGLYHFGHTTIPTRD